MSETMDRHGVLTEPRTIRFERLLPGPVERVWAYLTQSDLRAKWLASGPMDLVPGGAMELVWRNDGLSPEREERPHRFPEEERMAATVTRCDPPRLLSFTWGGVTAGEPPSEVTVELDPAGPGDVRLVLTHTRLPAGERLAIASGWHTHLDILDAVARGRTPGPFWSHWQAVRAGYAARIG